MYRQILSFLFLVGVLLSCGMSPEKIQVTEASLVAQSNGNCQQDPEYPKALASNIVFQSNDLGRRWTDVSAGLPESLGVNRVLTIDGEIILLTGNDLIRGNTSTEIPIWKEDLPQNLEFSQIFPGKGGLYASSYNNGFFKEVPSADLWIPMHKTLNDKSVRSILETTDGTLFVGVESGLFKSVDGGKTWKHVLENTGVNTLLEAEDVLICATYEGLRRSTDGGEHWDLVVEGEGGAWQTKAVEGALVSITQGGHWQEAFRSNRLRLSTDKGKTWLRIDVGLTQSCMTGNADEKGGTNRDIYDIEQAGKYLFCSTNTGIFRSHDLGKTWELMRRSNDGERFELAVSGNKIYAIPVVGC